MRFKVGDTAGLLWEVVSIHYEGPRRYYSGELVTIVSIGEPEALEKLVNLPNGNKMKMYTQFMAPGEGPCYGILSKSSEDVTYYRESFLISEEEAAKRTLAQ